MNAEPRLSCHVPRPASAYRAHVTAAGDRDGFDNGLFLGRHWTTTPQLVTDSYRTGARVADAERPGIIPAGSDWADCCVSPAIGLLATPFWPTDFRLALAAMCDRTFPHAGLRASFALYKHLNGASPPHRGPKRFSVEKTPASPAHAVAREGGDHEKPGAMARAAGAPGGLQHRAHDLAGPPRAYP